MVCNEHVARTGAFGILESQLFFIKFGYRRKPVGHFLDAVDKVTLEDITSLSAKIISSPLTMASWGDSKFQVM